MPVAVSPHTTSNRGSSATEPSPRVARLITAAVTALAAAFALAAAVGASRILPWADAWLVLVLVAAPAAGASILAASLFAAPATRALILLLAVCPILALYVVEATLAALPPPVDGAAWQERHQRAVAEREGYAFDERDTEQLLIDLRAEGIDAWPNTPALQLMGEPFRGRVLSATVNGERVMPLAGISGARIDHCRESGRYPPKGSDGYGFQNPPGTWRGPIDVALVGDSFVHGLCTDPGDDLASMIRERVPGTVSVGMGGWGPLFMLGAVKEYAAAVEPDHLFWFYYEGNDLVDLRTEQRAPVLPSYLEAGFSQGLIQLQDSIDADLRHFLQEAIDAHSAAGTPELIGSGPYPPGWTTRFKTFATLWRLRSQVGLTDLDGQESTLTAVGDLRRVLVEARSVVESWGGRLHFVYLPRYARYDLPGRLSLPQLRARSRVLDMVEGLRLSVIDIHEEFDGADDTRELFFYPEAHYDEDGNRVVADAVLRFLDTTTSEPDRISPGPAAPERGAGS